MCLEITDQYNLVTKERLIFSKFSYKVVFVFDVDDLIEEILKSKI